MTDDAGVNWDDRSRPPLPDAVRISDDVYASWAIGWAERATDGGLYPLLWHWCTKSVWLADPNRNPAHCQPSWAAAGCRAHTLVSSDPLHLEPSVYWPDCCGMHGFIRDGRWIGA